MGSCMHDDNHKQSMIQGKALRSITDLPEKAWAREAKKPTGASSFQFSVLSSGFLRKPVSHMGTTKMTPTKSCRADRAQCALEAPRAFLPSALQAFLL